MAVVLIPDENRALKSEKEIQAFINPHGIFYEKWPLAERVNPEADAEDILKAYAPEIEVLKKKGGYVTADVMNVSPETPNLDEMMAKYKMEHTHSEDEVRFILKGKGLFHIHPQTGPIFAIQVEAGDLINVPRGTKHGSVYAKIEPYGQYDCSKINQGGRHNTLIAGSTGIMLPYAGALLI